MIFQGLSTFRVNPDKWDEISDGDILRMYETFKDWLTMNEENMTISEAEKAWAMYDRWTDHLKWRGLKTSKLDI